MSFELQTAVTMENLPSPPRQLSDHRPQSQTVSHEHSGLSRLGPRDGQLVPGWPSHQLLTWCGRGEGQEEGSSGAGSAGAGRSRESQGLGRVSHTAQKWLSSKLAAPAPDSAQARGAALVQTVPPGLGTKYKCGS